jgi:methylated-DNA-[protein]-cysteine S-methyltransferase
MQSIDYKEGNRGMAVRGGSCRFGLWYVHVWWSGTVIHQVRFATTGILGPVPDQIRKFCSGQPADLLSLSSVATVPDSVYSRIYRIVRDVPYGETATYGEISKRACTSPRVIGQAMARNPTPIVIPCHRIVGTRGIGGFFPSIEIKKALLAMERRASNNDDTNKSGQAHYT